MAHVGRLVRSSHIHHAGYKGSSDAFIDASVQLALAGARKINAETGKRMHILVPDEGEFKRSAKMYA